MASVIARGDRSVVYEVAASDVQMGLVAADRLAHGEHRGNGLDGSGLARVTMEARIALEEAVAAASQAAQRAICYAAVLDEALAELEESESVSVPLPSRMGDIPFPVQSLSRREREVLALVAEGRSNKAIAAALFVSPNTIKSHVTSLLTKLQAGSRVQLAAMAARGGIEPVTLRSRSS